jgi:hypothetical protein
VVPVELSGWPSLLQHVAFGIRKIWPFVFSSLSLETSRHVQALGSVIKSVRTTLVFSENKTSVVLTLKKKKTSLSAKKATVPFSMNRRSFRDLYQLAICKLNPSPRASCSLAAGALQRSMTSLP